MNSLGMSIGATQLVATDGNPDGVPVVRASMLTLHDGRPSEVGIPKEPGLGLTGFVDRVGDPVGIVGADGSVHSADWVMAEAIRVMIADAAVVASFETPPALAAAIPAHWGAQSIAALRAAIDKVPALAPGGRPMKLVPDARAALVSLRDRVPDHGVVVVCDLGGTGTSITLADATSNFEPVGETVRHRDFSGQRIDQELLAQVLTGLDQDPDGTASLGALTRLRERCRAAKEHLSTDTTTVVPVELPGLTADVRLTRGELEDRIRGPLAALITTIQETLERNNIPSAGVSAVLTIGGGAGIPLVTQQLSERLRCPIIAAPQPQLAAAFGAAVMAGQPDETPSLEATMMRPVPTGEETAKSPASKPIDTVESDSFAWSQADTSPELQEYQDYSTPVTAARPEVTFSPGPGDYRDTDRMRWFQRPFLWFLAAAVFSAAIFTALFIAWQDRDDAPSPSNRTSTTTTATSTPHP
ncbi:Hsp70 family protein [Mycobacteroides chelonae]|uniref:Hsp70 family protein n=1 Tax=Mycobacteroides chelonae TaxID=1774 RepID=UPI001C2BAE0C|nr:Hsp70 family protein [Mycobacteroides chelonae]MBV0920014.1 Hsp70 family protein [Mycobacteroides chelonae]